MGGLLTGRELDAAVAVKVIGWTIVPEGGGKWRVSRNGQWRNSWIENTGNLADLDDDVDDPLYGRYALPAYSRSAEAAADIEQRIRRYGLAERYVWQLIKLSEGSERFPSTVEQLYALVFATPEQRCRAALATVEDVGHEPLRDAEDD